MNPLVVRSGPAKPAAKRSRRSWTIGEKLAIVDVAKHSGEPVSVVAGVTG